MNGPRTSTFVASKDEAASWKGCWEALMRLAEAHPSEEALFAGAERLVGSCRMGSGDQGIDWLKDQLDVGQVFVAEQLAVDPSDPDWQRLQAVLEGACSSLADSPRAQD